MKVLIAGKGFIGEQLGRRLEGEGHEVKFLDRRDADYIEDITQSFSIKEEFDIIYHTVGLAPGFFSEEQYEAVHIEGTENILEGVTFDKIVYISALGVGKVNHSYFKTKQEAEELVKESKENYVIVRPSIVYQKGNKLLDMIRKASFTRLFPKIPARIQPINSDQFIQVLSKAKELDCETVDIAGPEKLTMFEMASRIYAEEGRKCFGLPFPLFMAQLGLTTADFLNFSDLENLELLQQQNVTDNNYAEEVVDLEEI